MQTTQTQKKLPLPVRRPPLDLSEVPQRWLDNSVLASTISDAVNLLFPHGERFFVRSVKRFESQVKSPELRAQLRGFYGQEGSHAREHERYFDILRSQGHEFEGFLKDFDKFIRAVEKASPDTWGLATTAAAEHFTAIMAEHAIVERTLDGAHPAMRELLLWHAAEEIEHKAVAFDVLQEVDPRYSTRVIGLFVATTVLGLWWTRATALLLKQRGVTWDEIRAELRAGKRKSKKKIGRDVFLKGILTYLKRDFHPDQNPGVGEAQAYLSQLS
ncbi:MAG: putative metal-dependent hydrolase [Polyangiales bacterium]|jgi:predicted metal-dependent hydrolase